MCTSVLLFFFYLKRCKVFIYIFAIESLLNDCFSVNTMCKPPTNYDTFLIVCLVHSYRKIPGDKCEGGEIPERKEIDLSKRCVSDLVGPELLVSTCAYQDFSFMLYDYLQYVCCCTTVLSAVVFTDGQSLLQIHTHCDNSHHCHATERRRRNCLYQEICLWWQVSVSVSARV